MTAPTVSASTDRHTVGVRVPFDTLAELLAFVAFEIRDGGHSLVAFDDLAEAYRLVHDDELRAEDGLSFDGACNRRDAALQAVEALLPTVVLELPAARAADLGFALVDAAEQAGIAGWCAACSKAVSIGAGIPHPGSSLVFCGAACADLAAARQQAAS